MKNLFAFAFCITVWAVFIYGTYWIFGGNFSRGFWFGLMTFIYIGCVVFYIDLFISKKDIQ